MSKKKTNDPALAGELPESRPAERETETESPEQKNVSEFQMTSTETATISQDDFWRVKQSV
jgi:hypothetical protein